MTLCGVCRTPLNEPDAYFAGEPVCSGCRERVAGEGYRVVTVE